MEYALLQAVFLPLLLSPVAYILGRKLVMSVLRMSDALDPMENLEIPDELKEIFDFRYNKLIELFGAFKE